MHGSDEKSLTTVVVAVDVVVVVVVVLVVSVIVVTVRLRLTVVDVINFVETEVVVALGRVIGGRIEVLVNIVVTVTVGAVPP